MDQIIFEQERHLLRRSGFLKHCVSSLGITLSFNISRLHRRQSRFKARWRYSRVVSFHLFLFLASLTHNFYHVSILLISLPPIDWGEAFCLSSFFDLAFYKIFEFLFFVHDILEVKMPLRDSLVGPQNIFNQLLLR